MCVRQTNSHNEDAAPDFARPLKTWSVMYISWCRLVVMELVDGLFETCLTHVSHVLEEVSVGDSRILGRQHVS